MKVSRLRVPAPPDWLIFFLAFCGISIAIGIGWLFVTFIRMLPYLIIIAILWLLFFRH